MAQKKQLSGDTGLHVHMVTPLGPVADTNTDAVTAPGEDGEFEVLPDHIPFLTAMHPGVLTLGEHMEKQIFAVGRGYLRVDHDGDVKILVEKAIAADDVDLEAAETEREAAADELQGWDETQSAEWKNLKAREDWANAQIKAHADASN